MRGLGSIVRFALTLALLGVLSGNAAAGHFEKELEAPGPEGPLGALLLRPSQPWAGVLIHPGSGPTDRDGNSGQGLQTDAYRLLAEGLTDDGIATTRIDKRGMYSSKAAIPDANDVTIAEMAGDLHGWAKVVSAELGLPCVWLLGHSEGGLVSLVAAQTPSDKICGLILVAAPGRPLGDILREQLRANPANAPILDDALSAVDAFERGERVDWPWYKFTMKRIFPGRVQGFLIDLFSYSPTALIAAYDGPVLILQGQRDLQVTEADARVLAAAKPDAVLRLLPDVNHVLKQVTTDDRAVNFATYADRELPLAAQVIPAITGFLRERTP